MDPNTGKYIKMNMRGKNAPPSEGRLTNMAY